MSTNQAVQPVTQPNPNEIEIRLGDIIQFLKDSRWRMLLGALVGLVIGALYAFSKQNEYTATVKVMPELKTSTGVGGGLGDLKSLAGLAGVNLGGMNGVSEAVRPDLYPDIIQSVPFSLHMLNRPVTTTTSRTPKTLQNYLIEQGGGGIAGFLGQLFSSDEAEKSAQTTSVTSGSTLRLTRQQEGLTKQINGRINAEMDKKSGIITITSQMPDAVVAATAASQSLDYLTNYVTNYRTEKARKQVQFLTEQVNKARRRYESAEVQLASYRDRNRSVYANTAKIEEQRLQADYLLTQTVYGELEKQLEQARIKVQEESPVFQVLEPAQVPLNKSSPKRLMIMAGFTVAGTVIGLLAFLIKRFLG